MKDVACRKVGMRQYYSRCQRTRPWRVGTFPNSAVIKGHYLLKEDGSENKVEVRNVKTWDNDTKAGHMGTWHLLAALSASSPKTFVVMPIPFKATTFSGLWRPLSS